MIPTREEALRVLDESYLMNPGPWRAHSIVVAECAEKIARACGDIDPDQAYVVGLLHDIGRRVGVTGVAHMIDGYDYLMGLGWDEAARIALTHSFAVKDLSESISPMDVDEATQRRMLALLESFEYDDYDHLIQLCDSIAMSDGPTEIETRMGDVKRRYGFYPQDKWDRNLAIKADFERRMGRPLNDVVGVK